MELMIGGYAYKAFDKNNSTAWYTADTTAPQYIQYNFNKTVIPYKIKIVNAKYGSSYRCKNFYIQSKNNNEEYSNITGNLVLLNNNSVQNFEITTMKQCQYVKMYIVDKYTTEKLATGICELQVYCREVP